VAFRYSGSSEDVFCGLDLRIPAGSSLAVVGLNGAGKTTLVKLLCRFYDPTGGSITVGGIDLRDLDWTGWQRQIAAIFQDFDRFPFTAADNVRVGHLTATDRQIEQAAAAASGRGSRTLVDAEADVPTLMLCGPALASSVVTQNCHPAGARRPARIRGPPLRR
jgi:ATP-binding cassette, subfamily B, bacterial